MLKKNAAAALALGACIGAPSAQAAVFGGIDFPGGAASFADAVVSYQPGTGVGECFGDPSQALGLPFDGDPDDAGCAGVSLGKGGTIVLEFTDNALTASGDDAFDLHIFEVGEETEQMLLAISADGTNWIDLGAYAGQPESIDIDPVAGVSTGTLYSYVRIQDDPDVGSHGSPFAGADIDAVGAITSAPPAIPLPAAGWALVAGLAALGGLRAGRPHG